MRAALNRASRGPETPQKQPPGAELNDLIRSLEAECRLGLQVRDESWSPSKTTANPSLADKVYGQIKHGFFRFRPTLYRSIEAFKQQAVNLSQQEKLELLHLLLKSKTNSPLLAKSTSSQSPRDDFAKSLRPHVGTYLLARRFLLHLYQTILPPPFYVPCPKIYIFHCYCL
jgi:hypothetical protein